MSQADFEKVHSVVKSEPSMSRKLVRSGVQLVFGGVVLALALISGAHVLIERSSDGRVYQNSQDVNQVRAGLVLGCARYLSDGRENLFFRFRIEKAAELYREGKVAFLIVSGDNSRVDYDEPTEMKQALLERGVAEEAIYCDYAGFSTLDSVVRAKEIFQQSELVVVSQAFHVKRAIYIGEHHGVNLVGVVARDVVGAGGVKTKLREYLARVKTVLDVHILGREPVYLGEPVIIQEA